MRLLEWNINTTNKLDISKFSKKWNIPEICSAILCFRKFKDENEIDCFLNSDIFNKKSLKFNDIQKAIDCLNISIKNKEKICIYGDYDVDGITSTALIYKYLKSKDVNVIYYIPDREKEGYGLNIKAIEKLNKEDVKLIITVDNGISAYKEVELANSLGMKVIITDHHKIPEKLPNANAIINPCLEKWNDKYNNFAGVGVAYEFIRAIEPNDDYLHFVLLGTIADSIPLVGNCRHLVKTGLKSIHESKILGIKTLLDSLKFKNSSIDSIDLAFKVIPKINASGRLKTADIALKLLISDNQKECNEINNLLEELNLSRKSIEKEILEDAERILKENPEKKHENIIVLSNSNWHFGILGIVASKIVQKYGKPCILISYVDNEARGSCRSIEGFSIYDVIFECSEYLERFGGHPMAAGINLKTENIELFSNAIIKNSQDKIIEYTKLNIDFEINPLLISTKILDDLEILKPFGNGNPEPVFSIRNIKLHSFKNIGNGNHLKLTFISNGKFLEMLYFNRSMDEFLYNEGEFLDVAFTLNENIFKFKRNVSIYIIDLKLSGINIKTVIEHKSTYEKFKLNKNLSLKEINNLFPSREDFVKTYKFISKYSRLRVDIISNKVFGDSSYSGKIYIILDIFENMGLIELNRFSDEFSIKINSYQKKLNLESSETFITLNNLKRSFLNG